MHTPFSIEESLRFGWQKTKEHSRLLFQVMLTFFAVDVISGIIQATLEGTMLGALARFVLFLVSVFVSTGFLTIALKIARGQDATYTDLMPKIELVWSVFIVSILSVVLIIAGCILLLIPGIYLMVRFSMVCFSVIDGAKPLESFDKSTSLTDGVKWELFGFLVIVILLNVLGAALFMIGLLVTLPVTMIAFAHIYTKLKHHREQVKIEPVA